MCDTLTGTQPEPFNENYTEGSLMDGEEPGGATRDLGRGGHSALS